MRSHLNTSADIPVDLSLAMCLVHVPLVTRVLESGPVLRQHIWFDHRGIVLQQAQRAPKPHAPGDQPGSDLREGSLILPKATTSLNVCGNQPRRILPARVHVNHTASVPFDS